MIRVTGKTYEAKSKLSKCGLTWDGSAWVGTQESLTSYGKSKLNGICDAYDLTIETPVSEDTSSEIRLDR